MAIIAVQWDLNDGDVQSGTPSLFHDNQFSKTLLQILDILAHCRQTLTHIEINDGGIEEFTKDKFLRGFYSGLLQVFSKLELPCLTTLRIVAGTYNLHKVSSFFTTNSVSLHMPEDSGRLERNRTRFLSFLHNVLPAGGGVFTAINARITERAVFIKPQD